MPGFTPRLKPCSSVVGALLEGDAGWVPLDDEVIEVDDVEENLGNVAKDE